MTVDLSWHGGVIAAGRGERLREGGWSGSKAMALVAGRPLVEHALGRFAAVGIGQAAVLINEESEDARSYLMGRGGLPALSLIVRTTPSSFASFATIMTRLGEGPAVVTTVDAILPDAAFRRFLDAATTFPRGSLLLGLTKHVDDENPLFVSCDVDGRIGRVGGTAGTHVTAGIYAWYGAPPLLEEATYGRLRDYLGWLVRHGYPVFGLDLATVLDVDRPGDVVAAEYALATWSSLGRDRA